MKERSKPSQLFYAASFLLGILTTSNMMLSTREPGGLALLVFGLATGATAGVLPAVAFCSLSVWSWAPASARGRAGCSG